MPVLRLIFFLLLFCVPLTAHSGVTADDFPGSTVWYAHADLKQMRTSASGKDLYNWLDGEVFVEIHEEIGIDVGKETDRITAFADTERGAVVIVEGPLSKESREKMLAIAATEAKLDMLSSGGKDYYQYGEENDDASSADFEPLEDGGYFSFDVKDKVIVTSTKEQMEALLKSNGKVAGMGGHPSALFVLTADKSLVQAGLRPDELTDDDDDWHSNILRNTEQAALLVADHDGLIAIEARLVASEPGMAESLGGIINGLISLQAFNSELEPEILGLIQNTKVEVKDKTLSINTVIDPALIVTIL
ncbi:MAG: hypothetical protein ACE5KS_08875, partial [Woeseiaceae bacterium]